ncbi:MAG: hypothetical protein HY744_18955 [Deltaproteobacteria bacterium]|nr:hypothetical protein [Deltaproteobacteria bacterium]
MIRLLVAGEGANELGRFARADRSAGEAERTVGPGVIEALLAKIRPGGWEIRRALLWRDVRKYRPGLPGEGEARTVNGLILLARELGCHALVFLRDRDGQRRRERALAQAVKRALQLVDRPPLIAAGVPVEKMEAWLLALRAERMTESCSDPVAALHERHGVPPKRTAAMVELVHNARLRLVPADARSLLRWLRQAAGALCVRVPRDWPVPARP